MSETQNNYCHEWSPGCNSRLQGCIRRQHQEASRLVNRLSAAESTTHRSVKRAMLCAVLLCSAAIPPPPNTTSAPLATGYPANAYPGYLQLSNDGFWGPCRLNTPTDNDRTAYGMVQEADGNWTGGQLLTTIETSCDMCADLCSRDVNITGYAPYKCVAFECTNNGWMGGPRCELWAEMPKFAGQGACSSFSDTACKATASPYHCFVKSPSQPATDALPGTILRPVESAVDQAVFRISVRHTQLQTPLPPLCPVHVPLP